MEPGKKLSLTAGPKKVGVWGWRLEGRAEQKAERSFCPFQVKEILKGGWTFSTQLLHSPQLCCALPWLLPFSELEVGTQGVGAETRNDLESQPGPGGVTL